MEIADLQQYVSSLDTQLHSASTRLQALSISLSVHSASFLSAQAIVVSLIATLQRLTRDIQTSTVNVGSTERCLRAVGMYCDQLLSAVADCERAKVRKRFVGEVQVASAKLATIEEIVDSAAKLDLNDLFSLPKTHPRWTALGEVSTVHSFPRPDHLHRHLNKLILSVTAGNAFISKAFETTGTSRKLMLGLGAVYYNLAKKKALRKARFSFANPNIDIAKAVWNLMDAPLMSQMMEKLAMSIEENTVIYVPRVAETDVGEVLRDEIPSGELGAERPNAHFELHRGDRKDWVQIRVLAPFRIQALHHPQSSSTGRKLSVKAVIFHIHGGGFIAMSSRSHQNYTRRWANTTNTVLFSVDYRLAPEHQYPAALDDVWAAYLWVSAYARKHLGLQFQRIVVTGDSAGGNLACGVLNKAIESGIQGLVPHGALLTYPALYLAPARYTPSFELALEDLIVHHTFLRLCLQSYVPADCDPVHDHYISPLMTPSSVLRHYPPVRIMMGSADPLGDDSWRLCERLRTEGRDVKLVEFAGMPHGFLGFDLKINGVKEARQAVEQGSAFLAELMGE